MQLYKKAKIKQCEWGEFSGVCDYRHFSILKLDCGRNN